MPFLINLIVALIIVGLFLWVLGQPWLPLDGTIKQVIKVIVIVVVVIWLLYAFLGAAGGFHLPYYKSQ